MNSSSVRHIRWQVPPQRNPRSEQQKTGRSVRAPNINSLSLDKILKVVVIVVQQIMTDYDAVLEED
jgi:hypothetical protein